MTLVPPLSYDHLPLTVQLDVLFAYANTNHKNAVKLSLGNDVPSPGSREAEAAVGHVEMDNVLHGGARTRSADPETAPKQTV